MTVFGIGQGNRKRATTHTHNYLGILMGYIFIVFYVSLVQAIQNAGIFFNIFFLFTPTSTFN